MTWGKGREVGVLLLFSCATAAPPASTLAQPTQSCSGRRPFSSSWSILHEPTWQLLEIDQAGDLEPYIVFELLARRLPDVTLSLTAAQRTRLEAFVRKWVLLKVPPRASE